MKTTTVKTTTVSKNDIGNGRRKKIDYIFVGLFRNCISYYSHISYDNIIILAHIMGNKRNLFS